jgi:hypothetical protein
MLKRGTVVLCVVLFGCARTQQPTGAAPHGGSNAGAAGAATDLEANPGCDSSRAFSIWGKPYDPDRDCIDVDNRLDNVACQLNPADDDPNRFGGVGFACLERLSDGSQYWVFSNHYLGFDARTWKRCAEERLVAPKGCYAAGCPEAPRSSCTLEETRQWYNCSDTGEYDANCCGRQACSSTTECAPDEECRSVTDSAGQWYCWDYPGGCDCGGPFGGPPKRLCMPPQE